MDEKWQDWYQSTLQPLLTHIAGQKPSAELEALLKQEGIDLALLAADTDRTQEYVFESAKLPEIRGGSELLQELNLGLRDLITVAGLPEECILFAGGGGFLALVPATMTDTLIKEIERSYPVKTGAATITCVSRPVSPGEVLYGYGGQTVSLETLNTLSDRLPVEDWQRIARSYGMQANGPISPESFQESRGFGQIVRLMGILLRQRKEYPPVKPILETLPFSMRCQICQVRPAEQVYKYFDELWPLCDVCRRKVPPQAGGSKEARSQQVDRFLKWLKDRPELEMSYLNEVDPSRIHYAQDLNELGKACLSRRGYIGFIFADGNQMGKILESLPTPQAYSLFSQTLQAVLKQAAYQALVENLSPTQIERISPTNKPLGEEYIHPLEPLVIGGDDLMLIVPADAAIPVAVRLAQLFEQEMRVQIPVEIWEKLPPQLRYPTISAGVVIADSHNPVRVLQQISKELCKSAKQRAYDERQGHVPNYTSTLDFLLLKSQSMLRRDVKQLRQTAPYYYPEGGRRAGRYLTAAPYTLKESYRLLALLKQMRQDDFPTSQLQGLVAALHRGRSYGSINFLYQQARLRSRRGEDQQESNLLTRLAEIWPYDDLNEPTPWHRVPGEDREKYASILPDLLELYPFVPRSDTATLWDKILAEADYADQI